MKKKIVIIRFGVAAPLKKEVELIEKISGEHFDWAYCSPFEGIGVTSFVYSDWELSQIAQEFRRVADETEDFLPVIVSELQNLAFDFGQMGDHFIRTAAAFNRGVDGIKIKVELSLDDLLELVSKKGGVDALSEEERELLNRLSGNL